MCDQKEDAKAKIDRLIEAMDRLSSALIRAPVATFEQDDSRQMRDKIAVAK